MSSLSCDNPQDVYALSSLCLENEENFSNLDCLPTDKMEWYQCAAIAWGLVNMIVGVVGNLLTMVAIPYAAWKKK